MSTISGLVGTITLVSPGYTNPVTILAGATVAGSVYGEMTAWTLQNSGSIDAGSYAGVALAEGGLVSNTATGQIDGYGSGVGISNAAGMVVNDGTIDATATDGLGIIIYFHTGSVINDAGGLISGGLIGIDFFAAEGAVVNDGSIIGSSEGGVYIDGGSVTNAAGAVIEGNGYGVTSGFFPGSAGPFGTVLNDGTISALGSVGAGVDLDSGGTISNAASGTIEGDGYGIFVGMHGTTYGTASGTVLNAGLITATETAHEAIWLHAGGYVSNAATGTIAGAGVGVRAQYAPMTVVNDGTISGGASHGGGIDFGDGGSMTNLVLGVVSGGSYGVAVHDGSLTVDNEGTITASANAIYVSAAQATMYNSGVIGGTTASFGIYATDGASLAVTNGSGGTIVGFDAGIGGSFATGDIVNEGTIESEAGDAVDLSGTGTVVNDAEISGGGYGVRLFAAGAITDIAEGTIEGGFAAIALDGNDTVNDEGLITGQIGIYVQSGTASILGYGTIEGSEFGVLAVSGSTLTFVNLFGDVYGANGVVAISNATVGNGGVITGSAAAGVSLVGGGYFFNAGSVYGLHVGVYSGQQATVYNEGAIVGGTYGIKAQADLQLSNKGTISGNAAGVYLKGSFALDLSNAAGGSIVGGYGLSVDGTGTVTNDGLIQGTAADGVYLRDGGTLTNMAAGVIEAATLQDGVLLHDAGTVVNYGTIGSSEADYGVVFQAGDSTLVNLAGGFIGGTIAAVYMTNGTVINAGTIAGAGGTAMYFGGTEANRLVIDPGAVFDGVVQGSGSGSSTLELASGSSVGTIAAFGGEFIGFRTTMIDAGARWDMVGGTEFLQSDYTVSNYGSLGFTDLSLTDQFGGITNDGTIALDPGTLVVQGLVGTGTVDIGPESTLDVLDTLAAGQSVVMGGDAELMLGNTAAVYGTIGNFDATDTIDMSFVNYDVEDEITLLAGNTLQITPDVGSTFDLFLDPTDNFTGDVFGLEGDGYEGTDIVILGSTAPTVTGVTASPATAVLGTGGTATLTLAMSSAVTVTGAPTLLLNDGGIATFDAAASTPTSLVFDYTVQAGQDTLDLAIAGIDRNGATIVDSTTGQEANLGGAITNPAGTLEIDTVPAPILALSPASDSGVQGDDTTNDTVPTITGTGIAGDTITVYDGTLAIGTGTVASDGTWSVVSTETMTNGVHDLTATQTNPSSFTSPASSTLALTIDTTPPAAPAGLVLDPASDSGIAGDDVTDDTTPTFDGTGVAGDTITLYDGTLAIGTATVTAGGTWSIASAETMAAGTHPITATQTDYVGNVSTPTSAIELLIDIPAPPGPLVLDPASDSGVAGDDITRDTTPMIDGTGTAGDTVTLYDGSTVIGTGTVDGDGAWSITSTETMADGVHDLTATETDPYGDTSAASATLALTILTHAAAPTLAETANSTTPQQPVLVGTASDDATITIYDGETAVGTASATASGSWTFSFAAALAVGTHALTATQTDIAGNVSALSAALTVDVNADGSYALVSTPAANGDTTERTYNAAGVFTEVDTDNAAGQLLQSLSDTSAILEIYDSEGRLIGTIQQPDSSPDIQPPFSTSGQTLSATTATSPDGSQITLLAESNVITSAGNDIVSAGPGADTIYATGPSISITGGAGTLFFVGTTGASTITGGTGSSSLFGGTGGGVLQGGSAGGNALVAGGGNTTLLGGGTGDTLVGAAGNAVLVMQAQNVAFGGTGAASIYGGGGGIMVGGSGDATMVGATAGGEAMWGGSGTTQEFGAGSDTLVGGAAGSNTTMVGGAGNTLFVGLGGDSTAYGGGGNDTFFGAGAGGAMTIVEGAGNDEVVFAGPGSNSVTGGAGTDRYDVVAEAGQGGGADVISGFKVGTDQIDLFGYDPGSLQQSVTAGSTVLTLADGTHITLLGVTHLTATSVVG